MQIQEFEYSVDLLRAVIWQYDDATALQSLLAAKQNWYIANQTAFWQDWYRDVFNLQTANDFGLSVWSILLGIPLFIQPFPDDPDKLIFGFDGDGSDGCCQNFDNGTFANPVNGIELSTEQKRLVLKLRYFQLVTRTDVIDVNRFMAFAFADLGPFYMLDGLDMSIVYVALFAIDPQLLNVLLTYDILPRSTGVLLRFVDGTRDTFGFDGDGSLGSYQNFDNGTFLDG